MAGKIYNFFLKAGETGGTRATAKLSMLTGVNSSQAISIPDSIENLEVFEAAMEKIEKEFGGRSTVRIISGNNNTIRGEAPAENEFSNNLKAHLNLFSYLLT